MVGGECEISIPEDDPDNVVMKIILYSKKAIMMKNGLKAI